MIESDERTLGWFGASIGTSLAFENITNEGEFSTENASEPKKIESMESIWLNVRTLIRNAYNAFETQQQPYVNADIMIKCLEEDWEAVNTVVKTYQPLCETKLYLCTYEKINDDFPEANFRNASTPKQKLYEALERDVLAYFIKEYKDELLQFKWMLKGSKRCVLLTHLTLDLVSWSKFPELLLLESHTGKVKERRHWMSKLKIKKDAPTIPFHRVMLVIFGDSHMFAPQSIKARKRLLSISEKRKWHPLTTLAKIEQDIKLEHEPHLLEFIRKYK